MRNSHPSRTALPPAGHGHQHDAQVAPVGIATCSICLRVLRGAEWIDSEQAILELRSFEQWEPLPLAPGLCDDCRDDIAARRGRFAADAA